MTKKIFASIVVSFILFSSLPASAQFDLGALKDAVTKIKEQVEVKSPVQPPLTAAPTKLTGRDDADVSGRTGSRETSLKVASDPQQINFRPSSECEKVGPKIAQIDQSSFAGTIYQKREVGMYFWYFVVDGGAMPEILINAYGLDSSLDDKLSSALEKNQNQKFILDGEFVYYKNKKNGVGLNNCRDSKLAWRTQPTTATVAPVKASSIASVSDNSVIETWMKTCTPFNALRTLEKKIQAGTITFRGTKVSAMNEADGGSVDVMSLRLAMSTADFKQKFPDLAKEIKLQKNKVCPLGGTRSMTDESFDGIKGAIVECHCFVGD